MKIIYYPRNCGKTTLMRKQIDKIITKQHIKMIVTKESATCAKDGGNLLFYMDGNI